MQTLPHPVSFHGTARFQLLRKLGEGGMGVVYEVFDRERNAPVALKTLQTLTADRLVRFKNEFRKLQDLRHPNLVGFDELSEADGLWFFTMQLVRGLNFRQNVRGAPSRVMHSDRSPASAEVTHTLATAELPPRPGRTDATPSEGSPLPGAAGTQGGFDELRLRESLGQLVVGLAALHDAGLVHRDIKPGNVLVTPEQRVVILDFGLVTDASPTRLEASLMGTVGYMAPEQAQGEAVGPAADWYSVGVILYEALTGRLPFVGRPDRVIEEKRSREPVPPAALQEGLPEDLCSLCVELLHREPERRPRAAEILARLHTHSIAAPAASGLPRGLFVGRTAELGTLERALAEARTGVAVAQLVHGDSGVGKSALVRRFLDGLAGDPSVLVLAGRCYERESVPYKAVDQVIEALSRHLAGLPRAQALPLLPDQLARVASIFPVFAPICEIAGRSGPAEPYTTDPHQLRTMMFATLRELWTRLGRQRTLVVAIDDLQWADLDSLALLSELMSPPDAPPMLLCATVRTSAGAGARSLESLRVRLGESVRELRVDRLPVAEAHELAEQLLSATGPGSDSGSATAIAEGAGGHPLFIDALVRHRLLHPDEAGVARPLGLDDVLLERATSVGPAAAALLELVCIAGGPIQQEACAHATGTPFGEFVHLAATLRAANLVKTHGIHRADPIEPYHDRVREAVAARLLPERRRDLHGRLARALEAEGQSDLETLAVHFREAGEPRKAARYAARAAERAEQAFAFDRAAGLFRLAFDLEPGPPAHAQRLRVRLAGALDHAGRGGEAALVYLEAAEHAGVAEEQIELRRRAAGQYFRSGRIAEGIATLGPMLAAHGMPVPATRGRAIASFLYQRLRLRLRGMKFVRREERDVPPELLRRIEVCQAMYPLGMSDALLGYPYQARNLRLSLDAGEPTRIVRGLSSEMVITSIPGEPSIRAVEHLHRMALELKRALDDPYLNGITDTAIGIAECLQGRWKPCRAHCERGERVLREQCSGASWEFGTAQNFAMRGLFFLGELAELRRKLLLALKDANQRGDLYLSTSLRLGLPMAHICIARDEPATAREHAVLAMQSWRYEGTHIPHVQELQSHVSVDLYNGDFAAAEQRLAATLPRLTKAMYLRMQHTRVISVHLRGRTALALAATERGQGVARQRHHHLAQAARDAASLAAEPAAWATPLAGLLGAGVAACRGDRESAVTRLQAAELEFTAADMPLYAAAARRQRGVLLGASAGQACIADADAFMSREGIVRCDRFAELLAPGCG